MTNGMCRLLVVGDANVSVWNGFSRSLGVATPLCRRFLGSTDSAAQPFGWLMVDCGGYTLKRMDQLEKTQ